MARVVMNHSAIQEYLDGKHGVARVLKREGARVLGRAKSIAPIQSGAYASSLRMFKAHTDRMAVRVGSDLDYAMAVEANHGVLSKALSGAAGESISSDLQKVRYTTKAGKTRWATKKQVANWTRGW